MNAKRLLKLADYLETKVKDETFNMAFWSCETQACAIGHATMIPGFRKAGFKIEMSPITGIGIPRFKNSVGWGAVIKFFNLDWKGANYLFNIEYYDPTFECKENISRNKVAQRIREFVATSGIPV